LKGYGRGSVDSWQQAVDSMDPEHEHMLRGGTVSNFFLRESLTYSHPVFVGGCYGLMISIALLLPLAYNSHGGEYLGFARHWGLQALIIISITSILGAFSIFTSMAVKRPPARLRNWRKILFLLPFLGLTVLSISIIYEYGGHLFLRLGWFFYVLPGPLWVHLSYAPRWRIIERIDRGIDPFEGMGKTIYGDSSGLNGSEDKDLDEVVEIL